MRVTHSLPHSGFEDDDGWLAENPDQAKTRDILPLHLFALHGLEGQRERLVLLKAHREHHEYWAIKGKDSRETRKLRKEWLPKHGWKEYK